MKILKIFLLFIVCLTYGQNSYFLITIEKKDRNFPNEIPKYLWVIDLSEELEKPAPIYFWKIDEEEKEYCLKYNNINVFSEDPKITRINIIEDKIYTNRVKVFSLTKRNFIGSKRKPIIYNVFITPISGNLFSCNINEKEGNKINYQGKVYFLDENFEIKEELLKQKFHKLESLKWLNYDFVKTYPYSQ